MREGGPMAIDFSLTPEQRALRTEARDAATTVLGGVGAAMRGLDTPEARWRATRPFYQRLVEQGWLRRILPAPAGGECQGMVDLALVAEEFAMVESGVALTLFAVTLGLTPLLLAGNEDQLGEHLGPFLTPEGTPLAAFAFSEPGGSANYDAPPPGEGIRATAVRDGDGWVLNGSKKWVSNAGGWDGAGADVITVVCRTGGPDTPPEQALSVLLVPGP